MTTQNTNLLSVFDLSETAIKKSASEIITSINNGELSALETKCKLKAIESLIKELKPVDELARGEAEKYGAKSFPAYGATVDLIEAGTKYDFLNCDDTAYNDMMQELIELEEKIKQRETFLKALDKPIELVNQSTGEIETINPPIKTSTSTIKVTFK